VISDYKRYFVHNIQAYQISYFLKKIHIKYIDCTGTGGRNTKYVYLTNTLL